ncbi:LysR family transcriptional regulator [Antarcticirhabdus aurantiaca]|uniref:LysR family transcriptional regulator n=1 Tax=Antarcticirhabdus aurantiaca TaxID=2606717 RepID=A0ACD4NNQ3_9HYPH|nr:LysR family transcriptional regulator [Antarcticirhabdus aurantiaca]WAJ28235.1 LysR family transcriptional regulator [Jeongeuplla avenae]
MVKLNNLQNLRVFDAVARAGSLTNASRELGVSLTLVSKRLKELEGELGLRLVQRSTRKLALTEEGEAFLERCRDVLDAVAAAEDVRLRQTERGTIRLSAGVAFAQRQIAPRLPAFLDRHPDVTIQLMASNEMDDLIQHRLDFAIRQLDLTDSALVMRRLAPDARILCASPAYLARHGTPRHPRDLQDHRCLAIGLPPPRRWPLWQGEDAVEIEIASTVTGTSGEIAHAAALADGGITLKSVWDLFPDIRSGRLVRVLPEWSGGRGRWLHLVYPARRHQPRRVRALMDFLQEELAQVVQENADLGLLETS